MRHWDLPAIHLVDSLISSHLLSSRKMVNPISVHCAASDLGSASRIFVVTKHTKLPTFFCNYVQYPSPAVLYAAVACGA